MRDAGGPAIRIVMGGPARTAGDIAMILAHGVERLHVESLQAMRLANAVAERAGAILQVLLRVNLVGPVPGATLTMGGSRSRRRSGLAPDRGLAPFAWMAVDCLGPVMA